ncbi:MAG: AraC family transcriptional regulator [Woeseiaceae bacterium]
MIIRSEFHTKDIEFVEARHQEEYGWHSRVLLKRESFGYSIRTWKSGDVVIGSVECAVDEVVRACVPRSTVLIHLPQDHANRYRIGRQSLTAMADRAVLLPSNHEYTLKSMYGRKLGLSVNAELLVAELEKHRSGRRGHTLIKPHEIRLTMPARGRLFALYRRFRLLADAAPDPGHDRAVQLLNTELAAWCAERILENEGCQPLSPRNRMRADQIVDWIDRHLAEPISVDRLAELSGIRDGGLNKIVKAARGMAPMELVQSRRLAAAQRMLRSADEDTLVTRVALDCGFSHLGRFASAYRHAFGEAPCDTLKRARSKD